MMRFGLFGKVLQCIGMGGGSGVLSYYLIQENEKRARWFDELDSEEQQKIIDNCPLTYVRSGSDAFSAIGERMLMGDIGPKATSNALRFQSK